MDEERETAAEDQGYRQSIPSGRERIARPICQKPKSMPTNVQYENLLDKGLMRVMFNRGSLTGYEYVLTLDNAMHKVKHGWAVKSENQRRVRQA